MIYPIKMIYVAGPLSGDVANNVEAARRHAAEIWKMGAYPLVPHLNSPVSLFADITTIKESDIYLADLEILRRCDAVFLLPRWEASRGANYEHAWAKHHAVPVFESLSVLEAWVKEAK